MVRYGYDVIDHYPAGEQLDVKPNFPVSTIKTSQCLLENEFSATLRLVHASKRTRWTRMLLNSVVAGKLTVDFVQSIGPRLGADRMIE